MNNQTQTNFMTENMNRFLSFKNYVNKDYDEVDINLDDIIDHYLKPQGKYINPVRRRSDPEVDGLRKKLNGILNKLNEENYEIIKKQLLEDIEINSKLLSKKFLDIFVNILFRKMLYDICYIDIYIKIIESIVNTKYYNLNNNENFRVLFINKLQNNFINRNINDKLDNTNSIIILCYLYKKNIVAEEVIIYIINELKDSKDSLDLDLLYTLFKYTKSEINKKLDLYKKYMTSINNIKNNPKIENRIKCLFQNFK